MTTKKPDIFSAETDTQRTEHFRGRLGEVFEEMGLDPKTASDWFEFYRRSDYDRDLQIYGLKKAIELDPDNARYHYAYSLVLSQTGKHNEALRLAQRAIELDPDAGYLYENLASLIEENNAAAKIKCEEANSMVMELYLHAVKKDDTCIYAHLRLGQHFENRSPDLAMDSYRKVLAVQPHNLQAMHPLASLCNATGRYEEAIQIYRKIVELGKLPLNSGKN